MESLSPLQISGLTYSSQNTPFSLSVRWIPRLCFSFPLILVLVDPDKHNYPDDTYYDSLSSCTWIGDIVKDRHDYRFYCWNC